MSGLKCKPGDLAVIVRSTLGNEGRIVTVLRPSNGNGVPQGGFYSEGGVNWRRTVIGFTWAVEAIGSPLKCSNGKEQMVRPFLDASLRPIRDNPGDDESLGWVPVPKRDGVPA